MKEVSCQAVAPFLQQWRERGLPFERLLSDVAFSAAHLENPHERIPWDAYAALMKNAASHLSDEDFDTCGASFIARSRVWRPAQVVARLLFDAREFYIWTNTAGTGGGNQLFSCIQVTWEDVERGRMRMRLAIPPDRRASREFFVTTRGGLAAMPQVLGLPSASVEMTLEERAAVYDIRYPLGGGALSWLRRVVMWPFTVRAAALELKDAHVLLSERYQELDQARAKLHRQATQLRTAHRISQIVHGDLDLDHTLEAVKQALLDEAGFVAVEIRLLAEVEELEVARVSTRGERTQQEPISRDVEIRGRRLGEILLWPRADSPREEADELCDYVVPTVAMALDNALAFTALVDYRNNLERRVEQRTEELAEARDHLADTVKHLETAQAARDRIFANINHEIRTPLSLILLATRALERKERERISPASRQRLSNIEISVQRLLHLVDGLLLLAAGQEDKLKLSRRRTDLALLLQQIAALWTPAADEAGLSLCYGGVDRCLAFVDASAIERAVTNLLSNAVKFTPPSGSVEIALVDDGDEVCIEVRDTGIGVDEAARSRLFGRFEQDRPAVRPGARGSGIGLSIVKEIAVGHGGSAGFHANRAGGSTFFLRLPRGLSVEEREVPLAEITPLRLSPAIVGVNPSGPEEPVAPPARIEATVLVAEDDPELRRAIGEVLSDRYRVVLARDGLEALRKAREQPPDLLITDLGMPGMDGLELTQRFRELPQNRLAPVIMLTAYGDLEDRLSGFEAGVLDYVLKPFVPEELLARVRSQLGMRALALKLHESEQLASLGTLSAALAHELRNPANGIVNAMEPLLEALPAEAKAEGSASRQLLDVIAECSLHIRDLARELLGFARPGSLGERSEPLAGLVARALSITEAPLRDLTVIQELEYQGDVACAGHLIVQVLVNLLENAAAAAGPGGSVRVASRREGELVVLEVVDSGPGVPPELKHRIFEPFFTTKEPGKGTGLGLYTSRKVAEQHGGALSCETRAEGGCFQLTLPAKRSDAPAASVLGAGSARVTLR